MMIFGHSEKVEFFKNLAVEGNLSHAYLFYGESQIGKFLFAKSLAYFLEFGNFEPGEKILIDAAVFAPNEKDTIGIDTAKEIKSFLRQTPFNSPRRTAIIDRAEKLTPEAQGALLKIVEEPPARGLIIFIISNKQFLFPPLLSRLAKIYFRNLPKEEIEKILVQNFKTEKAKAKILADDSFGRIGRALAAKDGLTETTAAADYSNKDNFELELGKKILLLRKNGILKNAPLLSFLLSRETLLKRYNLNQNLQKKAVAFNLKAKF